VAISHSFAVTRPESGASRHPRQGEDAEFGRRIDPGFAARGFHERSRRAKTDVLGLVAVEQPRAARVFEDRDGYPQSPISSA
jgi:hypothetical protein